MTNADKLLRQARVFRHEVNVRRLGLDGQLDLPARGDAPEESHLAAEETKWRAVAQRMRINEYIIMQAGDGATCDEIEDSLGIRHQTASARMKDLKDSGDIIRHPDRAQRKTRGGSKAGVWVAK